MFDSILIICTGNICRSPYAQEKMHQLLPNRKIDSAGIATEKTGLQGKSADGMAIDMAKEMNVDISLHTAKQITQDLVNEYDLILTMDRNQIEILCRSIPTARHKTFLLGHWIGLSKIEDPYQKDEHVFRQVFMNIDKALNSWCNKLQ